MGSTDNAPWQVVDYRYNIRGWLTDINDTGQLQKTGQPVDLFAFRINYNNPVPSYLPPNSGVKPLYNGNIAETYWRTASDNSIRGYAYNYDDLNRLTDAYYQKPDAIVQAPQTFDEYLSYDLNGNITNLVRYSGDDLPGNTMLIDDLQYTYANNSNQLNKVQDNENSLMGFADGTNTGNDYKYDTNDFRVKDFEKVFCEETERSSMISDKNKGITSITYNHLNLPTEIKWTNTKKINYLYNAIGEKIQKTVTNGTNIKTTDYLDGFQYNDDILEFFPHAEGYVKATLVNPNKKKYAYNYVFNYTDHLGNIRVSYSKDPQTGDLKILDESHYYPFGLKHQEYQPNGFLNNSILGVIIAPVVNNPYKYKFNGKEWQDELGLNMYAMDMRMYDPAIARWGVMDPVIHHSMSPYNAFDNNPVFWADPSGADSENNLWDETDKSRSTEKMIQEKAAENSNRITTTYVNRDTGESVWVNDGVNEIVPVNSYMFAKAKNFANYFNKYFVLQTHPIISKYKDFYYEARYGKAYLFDIDYWLDSGPKVGIGYIGGPGALEYLGAGGVFKVGKFVKVGTSLWPAASNGRIVINGIEYTTHALERMQPVGTIMKGATSYSRGIPPSVVENAIKFGEVKSGNTTAEVVRTFENVRVITNPEGTRVISVIKIGN